MLLGPASWGQSIAHRFVAILVLQCAGLLSGDGGDRVLTATEVTSEELSVDAKVKDAVSGKASFETVWCHTLYHLADLPFSKGLADMPDTFTPFKNDVEKQCEVGEVHKTPAKGDLPLPKGLEATPEASWGKLPLADSVKEGGPPQAHPNAVLQFVVRTCMPACRWSCLSHPWAGWLACLLRHSRLQATCVPRAALPRRAPTIRASAQGDQRCGAAVLCTSPRSLALSMTACY